MQHLAQHSIHKCLQHTCHQAASVYNLRQANYHAYLPQIGNGFNVQVFGYETSHYFISEIHFLTLFVKRALALVVSLQVPSTLLSKIRYNARP